MNRRMLIFPTLLKLSGWEVLRMHDYSQAEITTLISNMNLPATLKAELEKMNWIEST